MQHACITSLQQRPEMDNNIEVHPLEQEQPQQRQHVRIVEVARTEQEN